ALAAGAGKLLPRLLLASFQGTIFIAAVWLLCRLLPRLPASLRCTLWWLACLKLLLGLVALAPLPLAILPASQAPAPAGGAPLALPLPLTPATPAPLLEPQRPRSLPAALPATPGRLPIRQARRPLWSLAGIALW
ncbi:MAG: hypothetical protein M3O15_04430, partial [Acidobacteriota bacterium]|nr:hypothetical protein [Acidobacteriota bacterium]